MNEYGVSPAVFGPLGEQSLETMDATFYLEKTLIYDGNLKYQIPPYSILNSVYVYADVKRSGVNLSTSNTDVKFQFCNDSHSNVVTTFLNQSNTVTTSYQGKTSGDVKGWFYSGTSNAGDAKGWNRFYVEMKGAVIRTHYVKNRTVTVNYTPPAYTIKKDDGSGNVTTLGTVTYDQAKSGVTSVSLGTPTKSGYKFTGWKCVRTVGSHSTTYGKKSGSSSDSWVENPTSYCTYTDTPTITGSWAVCGENESDSYGAGVVRDATFTFVACFAISTFSRTWNYDGGTYNNKSSLSENISSDTTSTSMAPIKPTKQGYTFVGWDKSYDGGYITQDGYKGYTSTRGDGWQVTTNSDCSTKYKLDVSGFTANTWRYIRFGDYDVNTSSNITICGWIRLISTPVNLNFYHGEQSNDWANNKKVLTPSNANGKWQYFTITRDTYTEAKSTGCFEIFSGNLLNIEGTIEFDLREIQIIDNNTGADLLQLKTVQLTSDITITALYRAAAYVTYDSIFSMLSWRKHGISGSNAVVSDISNTGFTLTSNAGVAEGTASSHYFAVEAGKAYKIDIDIAGNNWDVYIFFCDDKGAWVDFSDSKNRYTSNGGGVQSRIFTAPSGSVKAQIRVDANNASNTVSFDNFRIYPADCEYMSDTVSALERTDIGAWSMPTPTRSGYKFVGWNTKPDGTGTTYTASSGFPVEDTTLYSQWKNNSKIYPGTAQIVGSYIGTLKLAAVCIGTEKIYES